MKKILMERKSTYQDHIDVGLFYLPDQRVFVTWLINNQVEAQTDTNDATMSGSGHYYRLSEFEEALKDFERRN